MKKRLGILLLFSLFVTSGVMPSAGRVRAAASTITEAAAPTEILSGAVVPAMAGAVVAVDTFSLIQASGSATLTNVVVLISDPGTTGLVNTDIASVSLRKESGVTPNFQANEDLAVTGAIATTPAIDLPTFLTPTTPEVIGAVAVQYYIVATVAAAPTSAHNFAISFGADYGIDDTAGAVGSALLATKKVLIDTVDPSDPSAGNYSFIQNTPGTQDQIAVNSGQSVGTSGDTVNIYAGDGTTLLGSGVLGGSPVQFSPINIGNNTQASVKIQFVDPAGNTSAQVAITGNDIVSPTATATAYTDRIIIQFSEQVDGMMAMNCANYTVGGSALTCGGMGLPFVDVQGDKATIRGLSLSGTTSLVISSGNTITDLVSHNPLTAYSSGSLAVNTLSLPAITTLSSNSGSIGDSLTITGTNFGTGTAGDADHKVFFSGGFSELTGPLPSVEADYTGASWSATSITVKVPSGAQGGPVNVLVGGVMSDMNQNSFFDLAANYVAKVYYDDTGTLMPDADKDNIRIVISGMDGQVVHYDGDGATTYDASTDQFTITGVSSMGWTWAYEITGAHLTSGGQQVDTSAAQNHILKTTAKKISGSITLGSPCTSAGQTKDVVIFAMPDQVDTGSSSFKSMDPVFFKTNGSCTVNYSVGIPVAGVYRVEAHIPPDPTSLTVGSATFTDPDALSVNITDASPTATGQNFAFTTATHRIVGSVVKPSGGFGTSERGMLYVYAYQPREGGRSTGTQVANDGTFTLYVTPGTWKVGVGGENMSFPVEVQVDVDDTYLVASPAKGPTIVIAPPADFIEGYVKDSAGNGLANTSLYAWLEGAPGGGNAQTDSQGYYKMYVAPGSNYHIGAHSKSYGFLGEQSGIAVTGSVHPTVNFTVSSSDNYLVSGTITKGGSPLQQAFVYITEGEYGQMLGGGGTDSAGIYAVRVSGGSNRWLHIGLPAKGEIYKESLGLINADDSTHNVSITSSTIKVRISPPASFTEAFVGVHSDNGGGFSDTDVSTSGSYREYQIDIQRPGTGSTTYYIDGGIPGYGPLPQASVVVNSNGTFTDASGTADDGIIEITLGGLYTVTGTITGANVTDAWVWASGPNGGNGAAVASNGTYSLQLRDGTYDVGVGKPGYIGNKVSITVNGAPVPATDLTLVTAGDTITGTVYLPDGVTAVTSAQVWADNGSGGFAGASTDASGNYSLSVGSGSWTVKAAYDGYDSTGVVVTAPAVGRNIILTTVSGFTPDTKNSPMTPSDGGIVSGTGFKVDFPKNALGTGTSAGTIEVKSTTNVVTRNDRKLVGTAKEITARNSANQNVTTLSGSATIELTVSRAELVTSGLDFSQVKDIKITYYDSTGGSWVEIPTVVTLSVPSAASIAELEADPAITLTGTTTHLSTYSPSIPTDSDAPATPTGFTATAGNGSVTLSWSASVGATKYDVYQKVGSDYPFLIQRTSTSYTVSGLTNGTTYYFKVSALDDSDRESAATAAVSATPVATSSGSGSGGGPFVTNNSSTESSTSSETSSVSLPSLTSVSAANDETVGITRDVVGHRLAPASGVMGLSPFNQTEEEISEVQAGWLIRSMSNNSVYYVNADGERRVFWDAEAYFTWSNDWNDVVWVTDATLPTLPIGSPMLPKPGVVLVKIVSDPSVYKVETDESGASVLRHIASEEVANAMYGSQWADDIIDVEPTLMSHYVRGTDVTTAETIDSSQIKTRMEVEELAD